ncbi:glycosyltransferase|uniref:Glycosyltransferase n=1 Tax=Leuconostoc lactis TaxID=1246 RepID=A0A6L7AAF6_LEULA|nr:glycosyltransferase [Leuconostoc lactis]
MNAESIRKFYKRKQLSNTSVSMITKPSDKITEKDRIKYQKISQIRKETFYLDGSIFEKEIMFRYLGAHPTWFGKKEAFRTIGGYRPVNHAEDLDFLLRGLEAGMNIGLLGKPTLSYRKSLNKGIQLASGDFIARMDADDIAFSDRLQRELAFLEKHDLDIVTSTVEDIDQNGNFIISREQKDLVLPIYNEKISWIEESINSILKQTYNNIELLLILDNPRNTKLVNFLTEFKKRGNVILIVNEKNLGIVEYVCLDNRTDDCFLYDR